MQKKLCKSRTDRKLCGVCAGIAEYINLDPTIVRILWLIFGFTGVGFFAYIACAFVMPDQKVKGTMTGLQGSKTSYMSKKGCCVITDCEHSLTG